MAAPSWASGPPGSFEEITIAAARGTLATGAAPAAKLGAPQRSKTPATATASSVPGGRLLPDPPGIVQAGVIFRLAGATQGRLAGICPRAVHLPASTGGGGSGPRPRRRPGTPAPPQPGTRTPPGQARAGARPPPPPLPRA